MHRRCVRAPPTTPSSNPCCLAERASPHCPDSTPSVLSALRQSTDRPAGRSRRPGPRSSIAPGGQRTGALRRLAGAAKDGRTRDERDAHDTHMIQHFQTRARRWRMRFSRALELFFCGSFRLFCFFFLVFISISCCKTSHLVRVATPVGIGRVRHRSRRKQYVG